MLVTTTLRGIGYNEYLILTRTPEKTSRLIALLFCRPDHPLMKSDIIPSLPYFHFAWEVILLFTLADLNMTRMNGLVV